VSECGSLPGAQGSETPSLSMVLSMVSHGAFVLVVVLAAIVLVVGRGAVLRAQGAVPAGSSGVSTPCESIGILRRAHVHSDAADEAVLEGHAMQGW